MSALAEGDVVLTPRGERARVLHLQGTTHAALRYLQPLPGAEAELTLPVRLLQRVTPGQREPAPVRLAMLQGGGAA